MLGDLIYEAKGRIVYQRILAVEPRIKVENMILLNGLIHGITNISDIGTFINTIIDIAIYYSQGHGFMTTQDGRELAIWTAQGIQELMLKENGKSMFRGSAFYYTPSKGKLAFLNNSMTVFESEIDGTGNILRSFLSDQSFIPINYFLNLIVRFLHGQTDRSRQASCI